ncbi:MAG TPA: RNA polymerase sigma factor [Ignavibacteria bacterium]|nr:RNA polymerase sigma factor [Ignavibacteria bacterium]
MSRDSQKFLELLKPVYSDIVKFCKYLCRDISADDAKDVLQHSMLKAFENFSSLKDETKFKSWIFTIVSRETKNFYRNNFWKKFLPLDFSEKEHDIPVDFKQDEKFDNHNALSVALSKLSVKERSSILLFEVAGFSIEEIKDIQNESSISAVKSRLSRARQKMKKTIEEIQSDKKVSANINSGEIENETIKLISESNVR